MAGPFGERVWFVGAEQGHDRLEMLITMSDGLDGYPATEDRGLKPNNAMVRAALLPFVGIARDEQEHEPAQAHDARIARAAGIVVRNPAPKRGTHRRGHAHAGGNSGGRDVEQRPSA